MRMICASARASLRSVLFGIVFMVALAWRVSMQTGEGGIAITGRYQGRDEMITNIMRQVVGAARRTGDAESHLNAN